MATATVRTHSYFAEAHVLSGQLRHSIKPSAQVFLIGEGDGNVTGQIKGLRIDDLVSIDSATTTVTGAQQQNGEWITTASCDLKGLVVRDLLSGEAVVTADRIAVTMTSVHPVEGYVPSVKFEPAITNLVINSCRVNQTYQLDILGKSKPAEGPGKKPPCSKPYLVEYLRHPEFVTNVTAQDKRIVDSSESPAWAKRKYSRDQSNRSKIECSLVSDTGLEEGFGHIVEVPDFGRIFLTELTVGDRFELNMLRLDLSPLGDGWSLIVGGPSFNGNTKP